MHVYPLFACKYINTKCVIISVSFARYFTPTSMNLVFPCIPLYRFMLWKLKSEVKLIEKPLHFSCCSVDVCSLKISRQIARDHLSFLTERISMLLQSTGLLQYEPTVWVNNLMSGQLHSAVKYLNIARMNLILKFHKRNIYTKNNVFLNNCALNGDCFAFFYSNLPLKSS